MAFRGFRETGPRSLSRYVIPTVLVGSCHVSSKYDGLLFFFVSGLVMCSCHPLKEVKSTLQCSLHNAFFRPEVSMGTKGLI